MVKVSIIVPVYKVEKFLSKCIDSLINQTLKEIEIILVNDGSTDNSGKICDEYAIRDKRIKVIHKKNQGVSAARNDGLKLATGEYVIFCDSDDWMTEDACENLYMTAKSKDADIVIGDVYIINNRDEKYVKFYKDEFYVNADYKFIDDLICANIYRTYCTYSPKEGPAFGYGGPWNKLVKKSLLINNNIKFDLRLKGVFDDIIYTAYILAFSQKIIYIQKPVYCYRILDTSITHTFKPNVIEINSAIFNCWNEFFDRFNKTKTFEKPFYACIIRRLEESIRLYFINSNNDKDKKKLKLEYRNMIASEPYATAIKNVEILKLSKKQKVLSVLSRFNCTWGIWYLYNIKK